MSTPLFRILVKAIVVHPLERDARITSWSHLGEISSVSFPYSQQNFNYVASEAFFSYAVML